MGHSGGQAAVSLNAELAVAIAKIRKDLLEQMSDVRSLDDSIKAAREDLARLDDGLKSMEHRQVGLRSAILITLDSLDVIDQRLRAP